MTAPVVLDQSAPAASPEKPAAPAGGTFAIDPSFGQTHNIQVAVRLRPFQDHEGAVDGVQKKKNTDKRGWNLQRGGGTDSLVQKGTARKKDGHTAFHFDHIFDEDTKTPVLYMTIARPMVKTVLSGRHGTIFAYGQTGAGKTFTMQGDGKAASGQAGIIQMVASDLFRFMKQGALANRDYNTKVSYVEIYNEKIRDLLSDATCGSTASHGTPNAQTNKNGGDELQEVTIRATSTGEIILNCVQTQVTTVDEVLDLLISGNANRIVAATDMNRHSSRSHAIFRLTVESKEKKGVSPEAENEVTRISDFNLVDLAGSESVRLGTTSGVRLREGAKINQSLLSLSTVIHSLSLSENKRPRHINYRDSKLTRILQPHLSGNAEMAVLCCASPSKAFVAETRSTLKFAARAKLIQMKPKVNEVHDDSSLINKLRDELAAAMKALENMKREQGLSGDARPPTTSDSRNTSDKSLGYGDPSGEDLGYGDTEDLGYGDGTPSPIKDDLGYGDGTPSPIKDDLGYGDTGSSQGSLGYGDNKPPQSRQYVMPKDNSGPQLDGPKNRQYVMPKDHAGPQLDDLLPKNRQYVMPKDHPDPVGDDLLPKNRQYVMPKDHAPPLQSDLLPNTREYGMPKNQPIPADSSMKSFLKPPPNDTPESPFENSAHFQLDSVSPAMAHKTVSRYMAGQTDTDSEDGPLLEPDDDSQDGAAKVNSSDFPMPTKKKLNVQDFPMPEEFPIVRRYMDKGSPGKSNNMTATTEDESFDGPEGSYADISFKFGSVVSAPDTLLADSAQDQGSRYGTIESADDRALDGRAAKSWDTMDLDSARPEKTQDTMRHLSSRALPIPQEITIITASPVSGKPDICLTDQLEDAEMRARFLDEKLEMSDDLLEALFKDLERARLCIHDLVYRNVNLVSKVHEKRGENTKAEFQEGEVILEQFWLLKGTMYASLFFFFTGGYELFLASVILIWLILEANITAATNITTAGKTKTVTGARRLTTTTGTYT